MNISVVIPAFNAARFIVEAVESVRAQTLSAREIIVVDDASTDETAELAGTCAGVRCVRLPVNQGHAGALNRGIAECENDFVAFLDADDLWRPRKLERQCAALENDPSLELVYGHALERVTGGLREGLGRDGRVVSAQLPSALLARREALRRVGDFDRRFRIGSVVDWYSRALAAGLRIATVPEVVYERRIHGANAGITSGGGRADYLGVVRAALARQRR